VVDDDKQTNVLHQQKLLIDESYAARRNLSFEPSLERAFADSHSRQHSNIRIFGLLFLAFFALPSSIFEVLAGNAPSFAAHALPFQLLLIVVPCCAAAAFVFLNQDGLMVRGSCYLAVLSSSIGWVVLAHIGHQHQVAISYLLPSGVLLVSAGLLHLSTRPHVVVMLLVSTAQLQVIGVTAAVGYSGASILMTCFIVNITSCVMAWYSDRADRRMWLSERVLQQKVYIDELTQLLNRRGFWHHFSRLTGQAKRIDAPLSLLVVTLDSFSSYQQKYGYAAADAALIKIADLLSPHARRPFDLLARLDAGTYALCWYQSEEAYVCETAESIIQDVSQLSLAHAGRQTAYLTASAGCVVSSMAAASKLAPEQLIEAAGELLKQAQRNGGNSVLVSGK
jgi:diguanylate cyclase (GGDEF)-like protein